MLYFDKFIQLISYRCNQAMSLLKEKGFQWIVFRLNIQRTSKK